MEEAHRRLKASKKYADVCEDTLSRVLAEAFSRYKKPKDAEKAAREALHGITGAFMSSEEIRRARELLASGDAEGALNMHASTRERMPLSAFYGDLFLRTGRPGRVLDLACGINPIFLGLDGISVTGIDISGAQAELVNCWAVASGSDARVLTRDLLVAGSVPKERFDLALAMKLLPVLEAQKKGAAAELLSEINAAFFAVTFPTRTLGGRGVGMERHYAQWFEALPLGKWERCDRYVANGELVYILKEARDG